MSFYPGRLLSSMAAALAAVGTLFGEEGASFGKSLLFAEGYSLGLLGMVLGVAGLALAIITEDRLGRPLGVAALFLCAATMVADDLDWSVF